jgi:O-antigen biosynthesis protein
VSRMIADVDAFVTTSPAAREIYVRTYPELSDAPFHLIEHGRDLGSEPMVTSPDLRSPVRIVVPGALDVHKGATFIEGLVRADTAERLEFHFIGKVPEQFRHLGVMHGPYARDEFAAKMREIRPAFVGILSIWAETYSHTLSEAWASGLPVLVTELGAPRERVEQNGGGWILDHRDPARAYARILEICDDETEYRRVCAEVGPGGTRPLRAMASDYDRLYRSTLIGRRALRRPDVSKPPRVRRAALFLPGGSDGAHTGRSRPSSHIRMLRRLGYPLVRRELATDALDVEDFVDGLVDEPDVLIVQRTAVPPGLLDGFLETVTASAVPLVVDLDDNLFALEPGEGSYAEYGHHITSLERLIGAADLVTLSTESLRDAIEPRARRVVVVPNMLDEFLWFGDGGAASVPTSRLRRASAPGRRWIDAALRRGRSAPPTCNLVYMGTPTHADDLALLRPVIQRLRSRHDVDIRLFVVGGEDAPARGSPGGPWYERVELPRKCSPYGAFVPWLRSASRSWDVAVAPLRDTAFNRCKSDLKFLEYAALGLPGIYSDVIPYSPSVDHEQTGLLVENTVDAWCAAILRFALDPELRKRTAARAKEYVLAERCLQHQADDYVRLLREVSASSTGAAG